MKAIDQSLNRLIVSGLVYLMTKDKEKPTPDLSKMTEEEVLNFLDTENKDKDIDGILKTIQTQLGIK